MVLLPTLVLLLAQFNALAANEVWVVAGSEDLRSYTEHFGSIDLRWRFAGEGFHDDSAWAIIHNPPNEVWTGGWDASVIPWNVSSRLTLTPVRWPPGLRRHDFAVLSFAVVDNTIWSGSWDNTIRVWSREGWHELGVLIGHTAAVWAIAASQENVWTGDAMGVVKIWTQTAPFENLATFVAHDRDVWAIVHHGDYMFTGSLDGRVRVWMPTAPFDTVAELEPPVEAVYSLAIVHNVLWVGGIRPALAWYTATPPFDFLREAETTDSTRVITSCGNRVWTGAMDGQISVWDAAGTSLVNSVAHGAGVTGMACVPNSN
mmetsp:Transcript_63039/g.137021  ORF Transcript_63039/g.137021 Transcript_63039/m.137021 type:complete len:316 (-) Transcript_63039:747-1694(-)